MKFSRMIGGFLFALFVAVFVTLAPAPAQAKSMDCQSLAQAVFDAYQKVRLIAGTVTAAADLIDWHIAQGELDLLPGDLANLAFHEQRLNNAQSDADGLADQLAECY